MLDPILDLLSGERPLGPRPPPPSKESGFYWERAGMAALQFRRAVNLGKKVDMTDSNVTELFWDIVVAHFPTPVVTENGFSSSLTLPRVIERVRGLAERYFYPLLEEILRQEDREKRTRLVFRLNQVLKAAMYSDDGLVYYTQPCYLFNVRELSVKERKDVDKELEGVCTMLGFKRASKTVGQGLEESTVFFWKVDQPDAWHALPPIASDSSRESLHPRSEDRCVTCPARERYDYERQGER